MDTCGIRGRGAQRRLVTAKFCHFGRRVCGKGALARLHLMGVEGGMERSSREELTRKLERIEALYHRPGTPGEKQAAAIALNRLRSRLAALNLYQKKEIKEYVFTVFTQA